MNGRGARPHHLGAANLLSHLADLAPARAGQVAAGACLSGRVAPVRKNVTA